jgi:NADPH:quinone reductase-like Zn-dependent oxidoreductase
VAHIDIVGPAHSVIGCDYSGVVEEVGTEATDVWKVGDRIAGVVHGGLFPDKGAFAKYLKVHSDLAWRPPPSRSHQNAATYGISAVTAMQALYTKLDFP